MIEVEGVFGGYGDRMIVRDVSFRVERGEFFALLGPNGSGKTTLLQLLTGLLPPERGTITLAGRPAAAYSPVERARLVAVLGQEERVGFDFTVEEIVALGRYPHQTGWWKSLTKDDRRIMEEAMEATRVMPYRHTPFRRLSGGEKQRALLAKALAQQPELLLLDEPTNHLDLHYAHELLSLLKERQRTERLTVAAVLHDLNLAALYADRAAMMQDGAIVAAGDPSLLQRTDRLEAVYRVELTAVGHAAVPRPQLQVTPSAAASADDAPLRWELERTEEALCVRLSRAVKTLSNATDGGGFRWASRLRVAVAPSAADAGLPAAGEGKAAARERGLEIAASPTVTLVRGAPLREPAVVERTAPFPMAAVVVGGRGEPPDLLLIADAAWSDRGFVDAMLAASRGAAAAVAEAASDRRAAVRAAGVGGIVIAAGPLRRGGAAPLPASPDVCGALAELAYEAMAAALQKSYEISIEGEGTNHDS